jgi:adenylate kinase
MLRAHVAEGTPLGAKAKSFMDKGLLVPDELVIDMFMDRLAQLRPDQGFVLDGFPRTMAQAVALDDALKSRGKAIDMAIHITGPDDVLIERMLNRAKDSGRTDDTPDAIRTRLEVQKPPADLLDHYRKARKLKDVDGIPDIDTVTASIVEALGIHDSAQSPA